MNVVYVFTSSDASVILEKMIIPQVEQGLHGAKVVGMFFFYDNTFLFVPDNPIGAKLTKLSQELGFFIICCNFCTQMRGIDGRLFAGVEEGCFPDLYKKAQEFGAEQVISL